ncbi:hypothetical protein BDN72DRAFT_797272 [Pluteus cervinus]|uniref:Uncharacterized protein n=1 Tax=Pluteus cervinus TaxID=181527 RepID=A0ACD3ASR6_9AGAR|nr:hypothetical protein BDN72DRAFT_797272 [Pluteus cervinus]
MKFLLTLVAIASSTLTISALPVERQVQGFRGEATYYYTGVGNCGAQSRDSDFIVALSGAEYSSGVHCWQHIKIAYGEKTIDATVVDSCPGCARYDLDLSPAAFQALAPMQSGRIGIRWWYV